MSPIELVVGVLEKDAGIATIVASGDVMAGELPQGTQPPALCANTISCVYPPSLGGTPLAVARIQVTIVAANYQQQVDLAKAVRDALANQRVNAGGVKGASIRADADGPDFRDADASLWMQTVDFRVSIPA